MITPPDITGVAEIVLSVRDLPPMRDFYREVLGFELLSEACHENGPDPEPGGEPTIAFLTIKQIWPMLFIRSGRLCRGGRPSPRPRCAGGNSGCLWPS